MKLRPFFKRYGGKWRAAPRYPAPLHDTIVEPFAGAAGYALRYHDRHVVLVDADPVIVGIWDFLIGATEAEVLSLPDVANDQTVDDVRAPREARDLIGFWLNGGTANPCKRPSAWMREGSHPGVYWGPAARERIASQLGAVRHWRVKQGDYREAEQVALATYFVDPPYVVAGHHYKHGSRGIDFDALGAWCRGLRGQAIVCEAQGAGWLPFEAMRDQLSTPGRGRAGMSKEAVWTNGERHAS